MPLGVFGGKEAIPKYRSGFGGSEPGGGLDSIEQATEEQLPGAESGNPADPAQLALLAASYGKNLVANGDFEVWSGGTSAAPDGWPMDGTGASAARNTTNIKSGRASVDLTNGASNAANISHESTISGTINARFQGAYLTLSCWVKVSTANRVFIRIDDGVATQDSAYHTGDGAFQLLTVTKLIDLSLIHI